jgi:hypothetical protein
MSRLAESLRTMREDMRRSDHRIRIFGEIRGERQRQDNKWGHQHWPHLDPANPKLWHWRAVRAKRKTDAAAMNGSVTWEHILYEEICEAMAETDWTARRAELIQCAAVIVAEIEDGDLYHSQPVAIEGDVTGHEVVVGDVPEGVSIFELMGGTITGPAEPGASECNAAG